MKCPEVSFLALQELYSTSSSYEVQQEDFRKQSHQNRHIYLIEKK